MHVVGGVSDGDLVPLPGCQLSAINSQPIMIPPSPFRSPPSFPAPAPRNAPLAPWKEKVAMGRLPMVED